MNIHDALIGLEEDVSGTIIGDVTLPYQFWTVGEEFGNRCIVKNYFTDDEAAVAWFKEHYPNDFARGVEMRVFDKWGKL